VFEEQRSAGLYRYELIWHLGDDVIYYISGVYREDAGKWYYNQSQPLHAAFQRRNDQWECVYFIRYRIPDGLTSSEWLPPDKVPWIKHQGSGGQWAIELDIRVRFTDPRVDASWFHMNDEMSWYSWGSEFQDGINRCYLDAIHKLPINRTNNIANVMALINALVELVGAPYLVVNLPKTAKQAFRSLSDAWLQYRYVFTTTVGDVEDMVDLALRGIDGPETFRSNGYYRTTIDGRTYTFKCSVRIKAESLRDLQSDLRQFGLELTAYNAWDMVPFSFILDWFLKIGNRLEFYEDRNLALKLVPYEDVWYSVAKQFETDYSVEDYYVRWCGPRPYISPTFVSDGDPKMKTLIKRAVDVLALTR
jgi:hypothetical protein